MATTEKELIAHLARRAGFGATSREIERYIEMGYEDTVEELLSDKKANTIPDDLIYRRHGDLHSMQGHTPAYWGFKLISTDHPLEEKIALFWHGIFATAELKLNNVGSLSNQVDMFRRSGLGRFDDLLLELSKDPAMLIWLDNHDNHKDQINENYGREILELFSMGVGNYTEQDIKECARAFTGWTVKNGEYLSTMGFKDSIWPYGRIQWHYEFRSDDHDYGQKTFLGEEGNFNGDDVIQIICRQDATARFIARHIYNFFVADDLPVPQWSETEPRDPDAVKFIVDSYFKHDHVIKEVLRDLFRSDFFKTSLFRRVKSPTELIVGALRKTREYQVPAGGETGLFDTMEEGGFMGQKLLDPPSVEGWHTGEEWITSGSLVDRVNFLTSHMSDMENIGVREMIDNVKQTVGRADSAEEVVSACLDILGPLDISPDTESMLNSVARDGLANIDVDAEVPDDLMVKLFKLIVSSREYQLC